MYWPCVCKNVPTSADFCCQSWQCLLLGTQCWRESEKTTQRWLTWETAPSPGFELWICWGREQHYIISKTANQVMPAALMSRAAGAVDQPGKTRAVALHCTPLLFYGVLKTPSHQLVSCQCISKLLFDFSFLQGYEYFRSFFFLSHWV